MMPCCEGAVAIVQLVNGCSVPEQGQHFQTQSDLSFHLLLITLTLQ